MSAHTDFFKKLQKIINFDPRYKEDAYFFVMTSLDRALGFLEKPRHLSGHELLQSIREESREQFGPMTATVFEHWGIKNSLDFGHIVFNMVREGILTKTDEDKIEDFEETLSFENFFDGSIEYRLKDNLGGRKQKVKH